MNWAGFARYLMPVTLALAAFLVVRLSLQIEDIRNDFQQYQVRTSYPHRGDYLPPLTAGSLDGEIVTLGQAAANGRQLLMVFNTTCEFCRATLPYWQSINIRLDSAPATPVERIGISLDPHPETRAYVEDHDLKFPVALFDDRRQIRLYRAATVPQTLVLDAGGRVLYGRVGLLDQPAIDSVLAAATGRLPFPAVPTTGASSDVR